MWSLALGWDAALFSNSACLSLLSVVSWCGTRTLSKYCETFICNGNYQLWYFLPEHSQQRCISYYHQNWKWLQQVWLCMIHIIVKTTHTVFLAMILSPEIFIGYDGDDDKVDTSEWQWWCWWWCVIQIHICHGQGGHQPPWQCHHTTTIATTLQLSHHRLFIETQSYNSLHSTILLDKTGLYM